MSVLVLDEENLAYAPRPFHEMSVYEVFSTGADAAPMFPV